MNGTLRHTLAALLLAASAVLPDHARSADTPNGGRASPAAVTAPTAPQPPATGAPPTPDRLTGDLPAETPAATAADQATPGAGDTPAGTAPADPETVARELGAEAPGATPAVLETGTLPPPPGPAAGGLEIRRKYPIRGMPSMGVGSHDTYHVGLGVSTQLTPNTTLSAGIATGRWDGTWGWWSPDPFSPYRSFPELQP